MGCRSARLPCSPWEEFLKSRRTRQAQSRVLDGARWPINQRSNRRVLPRGGPCRRRRASDPWHGILLWLGYINIALAVFNLIPGYPLDGGRVLRAIIWWKTGDGDRSTRAAAKIGQVVAFGFIAIGIFRFFAGAGIGGLWIAFIGWFLLQAARESYVQVGLAHALEGTCGSRM